MNEDEKTEIYNRGFETGNKFRAPSLKTIKLLQEMDEKNVDKSACIERNGLVHKEIDALNDKVKAIGDKLESFIKKSWFTFVISGICGGMVMALNWINASFKDDMTETKEDLRSFQTEIRTEIKEIKGSYSTILLKLTNIEKK